MTVPGSEMGLKLNSAWIDDLRWHRDQYRQSRFQWTSSDALLAATEFTRGRQSFTTLSEPVSYTHLTLPTILRV